MLGRIFTVGGYTLLSRLTGFARDIMLAAIPGAGPVADAFFIAFRLPNHFRAIFAEGAFNAAFVPAYAHVHGEKGQASASLFADRIFTLLLASQVVLLILGIIVLLVSAIVHFFSIPYYPVWSLLIIALDVLAIWAVIVYGRDLEKLMS